jgi:short-subunit dehydrogenase
MNKTHALIVGGTGMLGEVTRHLLENFDSVTLLARNPERLRVSQKRETNLNRIPIDYQNTSGLLTALSEASGTLSVQIVNLFM